jgi:hypothetical protein
VNSLVLRGEFRSRFCDPPARCNPRLAGPVGDIIGAWSNEDVFALRRVIVVSALGALGCSNILGADFDPDKTEPADGPKVTIALPEHPHEALHVG